MALLKIIPSLIERDFHNFCEGIQKIQENTSEVFFKSQGGKYTSKRIEKIFNFLKRNGYKGYGQSSWGPTGFILTNSDTSAHKLAKNVKVSKNNVGILVCGSGTGMNIAANKHKNIRAAQCFNTKSTKLSRLHNDANIITLGSRLISKKNAFKFIKIFLNTKFEGGRHLRRVKKI